MTSCMRVMCRTLRTLLAPPVLMAALAPQIMAQDSVVLVVRQALEGVARGHAQGPVTVDPRVLTAPPPTSATDLTHPAALLSQLTIDTLVRVATLEHALNCNIPNKRECKTNGRAAFIAFSLPQFAGDAGKMRMFLRGARDIPAADSAGVRERHIRREAEMKLPGYVGPAYNIYDSTRTFERMNRGGATAYEVDFARSGGAWRVTNIRIVGQS